MVLRHRWLSSTGLPFRCKHQTITFDNQFVSDIIQIIRNGKDKAYAAVNVSMIATYWNIGRRIVLEEQTTRFGTHAYQMPIKWQ